jgi:hypothetical protein
LPETRGSVRVQDAPIPLESSEQYSGGGYRLSAVGRVSSWANLANLMNLMNSRRSG